MMKERIDILDNDVFSAQPKKKESADKLISWILRISLSFVLLTFVFKILHWPVPMYFVPGMLAILLLAYSWRFIRKGSKKHLDYVKFSFVCLYCLLVLFGEYLYYSLPQMISYFLWGATLTLLIYILSVQGMAYFNNENTSLKLKRLWQVSRFFTFFGLGLFCIAILFKMMHWLGANIALLVASLFTTVGIMTHIREN